MIYGYARISTNKESQKTDRQILTLNKYAKANSFSFDEIIEERQSGKTLDRELYQQLKSKLVKGDIIIITDIDRLGRNADQVIAECKYYKSQGIKIIALDIPLMCEWNNVVNDSMYWMIVDILITLKAHIAQQERERISERVRAGMAASKAKGNQLGRPKKVIDEKVKKIYNLIKRGDIKKTDGAKLLGITRQHLDRLIKEIESE